jgi:sugar (pentulose or hexulose) kinase
MAIPVNIAEGLERVSKLIMDDCSHTGTGTGQAAALGTDTQLTEETHRTAVTQRLQQGETFQIRTLMTNSNMPTILYELGLFMNGSGSPNTGDMLLRVLETFTKESADLLVVFEVTIS